MLLFIRRTVNHQDAGNFPPQAVAVFFQKMDQIVKTIILSRGSISVIGTFLGPGQDNILSVQKMLFGGIMDVIQDLSLRQSRGIKGGGSDRSIFRDQRQSVPNFLIILKIFYERK